MSTSCREEGGQEPGAGGRRRTHLRSLSTPDFSAPDYVRDSSGPYVSLEKLLDHEDQDGSSSSSSSSHEMLGGDQLFKRPARPAALRKRVHNMASSSLSLREKVPEMPYTKLGEEQEVRRPEQEIRRQEQAPDSVYTRRRNKEEQEVRVNRQPVGFDAR